MAYKTPGIYVKETSLFPPSVAEVKTAIPAFIGYTEKAENKGEDISYKPTRIKSLLEFNELFGGEFEIATMNVVVDPGNNYAVQSAIPAKSFYMFESLRLFFNNGGGNCYIVSVGDHTKNPESGFNALSAGIKALEKYDEPTMILLPDAQLLSTEAELYSLQQQALSQCAKLHDRVGVFDLYENGSDVETAKTAFRDKIGINNLQYGVAYTPWLYSAFPKAVPLKIFRSTIKDTATPAQYVQLATLAADSSLNDLVTAADTTLADITAIENTITAQKGGDPSLADHYRALKLGMDSPAKMKDVFDFYRDLGDALAAWKNTIKGTNLLRDLDACASSILKPAFEGIIAMEKNTDVLALPTAGLTNEATVVTTYANLTTTGWIDATAVIATTKDYDVGVPGAKEKRQAVVNDLEPFLSGNQDSILAFISAIQSAADTHADMAQKILYEQHTVIGNIVHHIKKEMAKVPPSGAIAGVYTMVDNARGVWKAPANVSLSAVLGPVEAIDDSEQEDLNVDVIGGKSINAIRTFTGRGTLVWGARTLAGNDNEWRYVPVRRFCIMVEESVKKSTAWAVFEPNSAPLWSKVKSMIDNYLIQKWREGALAGAKPEEAFFVKIGLGQSMTAQDILEGRLNVEIGMAVVRPAEFIVLKFSHQMQES